MELGIQNFDKSGQHLKWMSGWKTYQDSECYSRGKFNATKRVYYNNMVRSLSDTRSVDPLIPKSMAPHHNSFRKKKEPSPVVIQIKEIIDHVLEKHKITKHLFQYYLENNRDKIMAEGLRRLKKSENITREEIADKLLKTLSEVVEDIKAEVEKLGLGSEGTTFYMEAVNLLTKDISTYIAIDGRPVTITATEEGTVESHEHTSVTLPTMVSIDRKTRNVKTEITPQILPRSMGKQKMTKVYGPEESSGEHMTSEPNQFNAPQKLPPKQPMERWSEGIPNTNELFLPYTFTREQINKIEGKKAIKVTREEADLYRQMETEYEDFEAGIEMERAYNKGLSEVKEPRSRHPSEVVARTYSLSTTPNIKSFFKKPESGVEKDI